MTPPSPPETPQKNIPKKTAGRFQSILLKLLVLFFVSVLLVFILATATTPGTRFTLALVERYAGIQLHGVSGNLMSQLTIQHIEFHHNELDLVADEVALQWQPVALLDKQIRLDYVRVNHLQLALKQTDETPMTLPASLKLPQPLKLVSADQLAVQHLQLSMLDKHKQPEKPQQFSALNARVSINADNYQLQFSGTTPWGSATLNGGFETTRPFVTQAQFDLQGLPVKQDGVIVPATKVHGTLTGSWQKLLVHAQLSVARDASLKNNQPIESASGDLHALVTPFASLPIQTLQMDLNSVNPAVFYADAPQANLQLKGDFNVSDDAKLPTLHGHITIKNAMPMTWNAGGMPFSKLGSEITLNESQLRWQSAKMELEDGGLVTGSGHLEFNKVAMAQLPAMTASVDVKNVNLLRLDSRLKNTQLNGKIEADSEKNGWQFVLNLQDKYPNNLNASLVAKVHLNHEHLLNLQTVELRAKETKLTAQGSFALNGKQAFLLRGEAQNLNPANWIDVPEGRIATRFDVSGQLMQGWYVDAKVMELSGQFAGSNLKGESDFVVRQDELVSIKKLEFNWGENRLSAKGTWQIRQGMQAKQDRLQLNLAVPNLSALSAPFKKLLPVAEKIQGALFMDGILSGSIQQPDGQLNVRVEKLLIPAVIELDKLQATIALAPGSQGKIDGKLDATGLIIAPSQSSGSSNTRNDFKIANLKASVSGLRHAHQVQLTAALPRKHQINLQAKGDLQESGRSVKNGLHWQGEVQQLDLSGASDLKLISPFALQVSSQAVQMGVANWQGNLGKLQVQKMNWSHGQLTTKGQLQGLSAVNALKLWRARLPLTGNLQLDADWEFAINQQATGQFDIKRSSGDVTIVDISGGYNQSYALDLQDLWLKGSLGESDKVNSRTSQPVLLELHAQGNQLGQIKAQLRSSINKTELGWNWIDSAPLSGVVQMQVNDIQWMSQFTAQGVALRGELQAQAQLTGTVKNPDYSAQIRGRELQVSLTELGVLLPNGILEATLNKNTQFRLDKLTFSQTIKTPPKHNQLTGLPWINETGTVEASGEIDLQSGRGSIKAHWQRFPFLQNMENWLVASGDAELTESENAWNLSGQLVADAAYFSMPKQPPPRLSSDVVVLKKNDERKAIDTSAGVQSNVDFTINTGNNFIFVGRGLNTKLMGALRIRIENDGPVLASGSIQTAGGTYEGYGQELSIERGILNFQGPFDKPSLNVRALRRGLPVEAGVEIIGTVAKPEVRLISEPNVPDQDKLSWLVLGRGSDQVSGPDAGLLLSAAGAIFGGESGNSIPRDVAKTLGLDEISVSTVSSSPDSQLPSQTVAGTINNAMATDQIFSVGKRITPDLVFSIERSLTDATNGVKLTWRLTRRFSIVGRTGSDTSIDAQYLFSFN